MVKGRVENGNLGKRDFMKLFKIDRSISGIELSSFISNWVQQC